MTIFKSVLLAIVTVILISVLAYVFNSTFNEIAVMFLLGQVSSIAVQLHVIVAKLNTESEESE